MSKALTWTDWRNGGAELLMLRDLAPDVSEEVLAAAWRLLEHAGEEQAARAGVLELLRGCQRADSGATLPPVGHDKED